MGLLALRRKITSYRRRVVDNHPYVPTLSDVGEVAKPQPKTSIQQIALGCAALLLMLCLPLVMLGWSELLYRDWVNELDDKASAFQGHVHKGRRDASSHLNIWCHDSATRDTDVPLIVRLASECLDGGATKLNIDLSGTSISDESIDQFASLKKLDALNLSDTLVTQLAVSNLRAKIPNTEIIDKHNFR